MKEPVYEKVEYNKDGSLHINTFGTTNSHIFKNIEDALYDTYLRTRCGCKKIIMEKLSDTTLRITEEYDDSERYFCIYEKQPITYRRDD